MKLSFPSFNSNNLDHGTPEESSNVQMAGSASQHRPTNHSLNGLRSPSGAPSSGQSITPSEEKEILRLHRKFSAPSKKERVKKFFSNFKTQKNKNAHLQNDTSSPEPNGAAKLQNNKKTYKKQSILSKKDIQKLAQEELKRQEELDKRKLSFIPRADQTIKKTWEELSEKEKNKIYKKAKLSKSEESFIKKLPFDL